MLVQQIANPASAMIAANTQSLAAQQSLLAQQQVFVSVTSAAAATRMQQSQLLTYPYALPQMTGLYPSMLNTGASPDTQAAAAAALQSVCVES